MKITDCDSVQTAKKRSKTCGKRVKTKTPQIGVLSKN